MGKRLIFILIALLVIVLIVAGVFYFYLRGSDYGEVYAERFAKGEISNPAKDLSLEEAVAKFDESFVYYLLYNIGAYNLKEPWFSDDKPKIEFYIGDDVYNAAIDSGEIEVSKGVIDDEDIIIYTNTEGAVKMMQDQGYIERSFRDGESSIELKASKSELFLKGYLNLYTELTGESITGSAIRTIF